MRRIKSRASEERRRKKNQIVIGVILIIVMFGSVFGVIVGSFNSSNGSDSGGQENVIDYNGYEFVSYNGFWKLDLGGIEYIFRHTPYGTFEINESLNYMSSYSGEVLYISSEDSGSEIEIYRNFGNSVERIQTACYDEENCEGDVPIKDCSNNFIVVEISDEKSVVQENNCVFIRGPSEELTKITDGFLFKILGLN